MAVCEHDLYIECTWRKGYQYKRLNKKVQNLPLISVILILKKGPIVLAIRNKDVGGGGLLTGVVVGRTQNRLNIGST